MVALKNSPSFYGVTGGVKVQGVYEAYHWQASELGYGYSVFVCLFPISQDRLQISLKCDLE